jgi:hypothetical protein
MSCFIDLATQGLTFLRREAPLARLLGLITAIADAAVPSWLLGTRVDSLVPLIPALTRILVPLLSQTRHRACNQE